MTKFQKRLLFWTTWLLLVACLVFVMTKIEFVFTPVTAFFSTLFVPLVAASFLYYIFNPIVQLCEKKTPLNRGQSVAAVLIAILILLVILFATVIPALIRQISALVASVPYYVNVLSDFVANLDQQPIIQQLNLQNAVQSVDLPTDEIVSKVMDNVVGSVSAIGRAVSTVASAALTLITVPLIFVYMLKDSDRLVPAAARLFPARYQTHIVQMLREINRTIASYIGGQALVCLFTGFFTGVGYLLIGMPYAALLGVVAAITNIIPYVGPYLGLAPAVIIGLTIDPMKAVLACVVVLVVQQIESNFVSPNVLGKSLDMHPLTIIFILLVSGSIAGVMGMILGVPFYAVTKTIVIYVHRFYQEMKQSRGEA